MTPKDQLGNRYLVNFIDHKSNYCRVFLVTTKDKAAKKFDHFLEFFERRFNCRIHVLRKDGGGEYANVDLFCKSTGVARQISEARNQASNGKAELMHRTLLNKARSTIFASRLPVSFWGECCRVCCVYTQPYSHNCECKARVTDGDYDQASPRIARYSRFWINLLGLQKPRKELAHETSTGWRHYRSL